LLEAGVRATPPVVGLLASLGHAGFPVYKKPRLAVISTGNELVKPGRRLLPGQIYDCNSFALEAAVRAVGIPECLRYHAAEDKASTRRIFSRALNAADVVISAGGVSVGDYDYVKEVLEELGVATQLWRIAMKPGKPVYFGILSAQGKRKYVFALPGNPVSALVTFHQLVKPALEKMLGLTAAGAGSGSFRAALQEHLRKKAGRLEFVRGTAAISEGNWTVAPTSGQDSHMLSGLASANALIHFPLESESLSPNEPVSIDLLTW
jgi:molybdopterin molybdotransferase